MKIKEKCWERRKKIKQGRIMARTSWLNYYWQSWKQLKTTFTFQLLGIKQQLDNSASSPGYHTLTTSVHQSAMTNILFTSRERSFHWFWIKKTSASKNFWLEECYDELSVQGEAGKSILTTGSRNAGCLHFAPQSVTASSMHWPGFWHYEWYL